MAADPLPAPREGRLRRLFRRPFVRAGALVLSAAALSAAAGIPVYVFPDPGRLPERVDAVLVLGPAYGDRVQRASAMVEDGRAGVLVISRDPSTVVSGSERSACDDPDVICFLPDPATTRGEVAGIDALAQEHAWTSIAVITGTPHVTRARFIFDTCADVAVSVIEAPERDRSAYSWARQYAYQTAAFAKAVVVGCTR
jgi:uncharacterized SAM-binding protein YcdF (DUF218 family)